MSESPVPSPVLALKCVLSERLLKEYEFLVNVCASVCTGCSLCLRLWSCILRATTVFVIIDYRDPICSLKTEMRNY